MNEHNTEMDTSTKHLFFASSDFSKYAKQKGYEFLIHIHTLRQTLSITHKQTCKTCIFKLLFIYNKYLCVSVCMGHNQK